MEKARKDILMHDKSKPFRVQKAGSIVKVFVKMLECRAACALGYKLTGFYLKNNANA
jgi:hypothetical protein